MKPGTPQFRTALLRTLGNIEPDYGVELFDAENRTIFRMIDQMGRPRSNKITFNESQTNGLEKSELQWRLKCAGFPATSFDDESL